MKELRVDIRINEKEKETLQRISQRNNMTVTDYIRYRVFHNNPDTTNEEYIYETPAKDRHNYLIMAILNNVYWMLHHSFLEQKGAEKMQEFKNICKEAAKKDIVNYGYLKVSKNE